MSQTVQISLALVLPAVDAADRCIDRLTEWLRASKGIEHAHITRDNGTAELCVHFDPHVVSLEQVERLTTEAGASFGDRYRHEQIPFAGLDAADAAESVTQTLEHLPGMLHANVNYAAGLAFVAYDSTLLQRATIEQTLRAMGVRLRPQLAPTLTAPAPALQPGTGMTEGAPVAVVTGADDTATHDEHAGHDHGTGCRSAGR
jgi:Zn2+/Cd2+-exporting ATPase